MQSVWQTKIYSTCNEYEYVFKRLRTYLDVIFVYSRYVCRNGSTHILVCLKKVFFLYIHWVNCLLCSEKKTCVWNKNLSIYTIYHATCNTVWHHCHHNRLRDYELCFTALQITLASSVLPERCPGLEKQRSVAIVVDQNEGSSRPRITWTAVCHNSLIPC